MSLMRKISSLFVAGLLVVSCTAIHPPSYNLPSRNSVQAGEEIIVGKNQNVYGIARKHGVSMREIIVLNELKPPFVLRQGQSLLLPAKDQDSAPLPSAAPRDAVEQFDSGVGAAPSDSSGITAVPLEAPQSLPPNNVLKSAEPDKEPVKEPMQIAPTSPLVKPMATTVTPSESEKLATPQPEPASKKVTSVEKPAKKVEEASSDKTSVSLQWPVQGPILSGFGAKGQGLNNDGVNIAAPKGAPVLAAGGGIVVYAGNEMKGFGNLVLIRHEGGWVTAYAHLDRMMVVRDTVVAPGEMIGTVGSTGGVTSPQLHFETRLEGKPVDPQTVIKKS